MAKRIMVVEDNDLNRKLFCDVLRANGFDVEPVADGAEVLATARSTRPDLIIMDIQLPGTSGIDLIEAAKREAAPRKHPRARGDRVRSERRRAARSGGRRIGIPVEAGFHPPLHERRARPAA